MQKLSVAVTWIAVKIEEQTHKVGLRDLVMIFNVLQQREDGRTDIHIEAADSERVRKVQEEVAAKYEMEVFTALGFICHVDHPHKFMTNLLGYIFFDAARQKSDVPSGLAQVSAAAPRRTRWAEHSRSRAQATDRSLPRSPVPLLPSWRLCRLPRRRPRDIRPVMCGSAPAATAHARRCAGMARWAALSVQDVMGELSGAVL